MGFYRLAALLIACALAGCAKAGSVAVSDALRKGDVAGAVGLYEAEPEPQAADLRRIAEVVLVHAAAARDPATRARGFGALRAAGTAARDLLQRLAALAGRPELRVPALALLARMGDAEAAAALRPELGSADGEFRAAAVHALDPTREPAALRALLADPAPAVRAAAAERLLRAPADGETQLALARVARHDPALPVRLAALRALGGQGPAAAHAIEARLDDQEEAVRLAAIAALAAADHARASERLQRWLREDPRPEAIEAARALAIGQAPAPGAARDQLARALAVPDNGLRAQAAVALSALPVAEARALAAARLPHERSRSIRLWLALALGRAQRDGRAALQALARTPDMAGTQAQAELARAGDPDALAALTARLSARDRSLRALAVAVLARELGRTHRVRHALHDRELVVRLAAASAIVAQRPVKRSAR